MKEVSADSNPRTFDVDVIGVDSLVIRHEPASGFGVPNHLGLAELMLTAGSFNPL